MERHAFCGACGAVYAPPLRYPRVCGSCRFEVWSNPVPVTVVLVPVQHADRLGLLAIRRAIPPGVGKLALVGGFLEEHESWQVGGAREVREETGATIDPATIEAFWFCSTDPRPNRVLLFGLAATVPFEQLGPFAPDHETSERGLIYGADGLEDVFAFPLHAEVARRFFTSRGVSGPHAYAPA